MRAVRYRKGSEVGQEGWGGEGFDKRGNTNRQRLTGDRAAAVLEVQIRV